MDALALENSLKQHYGRSVSEDTCGMGIENHPMYEWPEGKNPIIMETIVKCPHCGKDIDDKEIRRYVMSMQGAAGTGKKKARDPEKMRQAALKRWGKARD
jgi:hypothetical protein